MITIGATGHRVLAELDRVRAGLDAALARIATRFPDEPWTVLTALAEGTDRLVVERARARGPARLVAVLPLPEADYAADFATPASRDEFARLLASAAEVVRLTPVGDRSAAYEAAGVYVVEHAQVLCAVWDGAGAQGRGGTGWIVERARARRLPLAWVHAGNRRPGTDDATSLGAVQGRVKFENF